MYVIYCTRCGCKSAVHAPTVPAACYACGSRDIRLMRQRQGKPLHQIRDIHTNEVLGYV